MEKERALRGEGDAVRIFLLVALAYFYCSTQRISAGVILPHMAGRYGFSASLIGLLASLFFYTYGFTQNLWGAVSDRVGPLRSCSWGLALAGVGSLLFLVAHRPVVIGISRLVIGFGLGAMFTGIYLYAALAFPPDRYPFWVGAIQVAGNLGTVAAVAPLGMVMDRLGYNGLFALLALVAFALAGALYAVRDRCPPPAKREDVGPGAPRPGGLGLWRDVRTGFGLVFGNRAVLVIVFAWTALSAAIVTLQGLWGVSWLAVSCGIAEADARFWVTFISVGLVVGSPLGAKITYLSGGRPGGMLAIMACITASWLLYMFGALRGFAAPAMGGAALLLGASSAVGMVYCTSSLKGLVPISRAGVVIGTGQILIYAAVIVCQWGSGMVLDLFPGDTAGSYRNAGYLVAFAVIALPVVLSFFSIFTVKSFRREEAQHDIDRSL